MLKKLCFFGLLAIFLLLLFRTEQGLNVLQSQHLNGRLSIYRDSWGVPHIVADSRSGLLYGVGYAHAQDRLWTLHFKKKFMAGRVSEMFGEATLSLDRYLRNIDLKGIGEKNAEGMDQQTRQYLQSYVNGINDYARNLKVWPLQFYLFWTSWEDWTTADVNSLIALFSITLEFDWMYEIARERLKETVGMELAMKLMPSSTEDQFREITIIKDDELKELGLFKEYDSKNYKKTVREHWGKLNLTLPAFDSPKLTYHMSGSNAWIVGKQHSATGRPIMANDPHVGLAIPSIFYPMELIEIDQNDNIVTQAFGVGSDGFPGLSIGKNKDYAWGATSLYADSKDVYVEDILIDEKGDRFYLFNGQWLPLKVRKQTFKINHGKDFEQTYYETHRGPLLSQIFLDLHLKYGFPMPAHHQNMLSLQIAPYTIEQGKTARALIDSMFSNEFEEFTKVGTNINNINIDIPFLTNDPNVWGFTILGRIPKKQIPEMGGFVKNGTTGLYDQQQSLTFEERPRLINPKRGYVAMTNNKFASDNYAHRASLHEVSNGRSYRIQQIFTEGIKQNKKFTFEDMMKGQQDSKDSYVQLVMKDLLKLFTDNREDWIDREFAQKLIGWLDKWNCEFDRDKFEPSIYTIWEHEFQKLLLLNANLAEHERVAITNHAFFELFFFKLVERLGKDDTTTDEDKLLCLNDFNKGSAKNPCIVNMLIAFNKMEASLHQWFGTLDNSKWRWGSIHKKSFTYVPWTEIPLIGRLFNRKVEAHGNSRTLNVGIHSYQKKTFETFATATFRFITDMNRTFYSVDLGVSDRLTSRYYDNFVHDFNDGKYVQHIEYHPFRDKHNWTLTDSSFASTPSSPVETNSEL